MQDILARRRTRAVQDALEMPVSIASRESVQEGEREGGEVGQGRGDECCGGSAAAALSESSKRTALEL
ncbi:MAG: hypothetical protein ABIX28_25875 [Vicinamibacterales bacterium]